MELDNGYGIWLLDLSLSWHYICPTFGDFLRLAVLHLGLMQWPYAFTPFGLSPHFEVCNRHVLMNECYEIHQECLVFVVHIITYIGLV